LLGFGLINLFSIGFGDVIAGHLCIGQTKAIVDAQCKMIPYYHSYGQAVETFHQKIVEYLPNTVKVDVISAAICVIMIPYVPIIDSPKQNSENTNIDTILSRSSSMPSTARACSNNNYHRQKYKCRITPTKEPIGPRRAIPLPYTVMNTELSRPKSAPPMQKDDDTQYR
jgi:hypothetical protein